MPIDILEGTEARSGPVDILAPVAPVSALSSSRGVRQDGDRKRLADTVQEQTGLDATL